MLHGLGLLNKALDQIKGGLDLLLRGLVLGKLDQVTMVQKLGQILLVCLWQVRGVFEFL